MYFRVPCAHAEVSDGPHVGPVQSKHEVHLSGPDTDAPHRHEPSDDLIVGLLVEIVNAHLAGTDLRREVSDRGILAPGQTRPA